MKYTIACESDIGKSRAMNQDAVAAKHISTNEQEIVFAVLCDGMGGFNEGEIASSSVVMAFLKWFNNNFLLKVSEYNKEKIYNEWNIIINSMNDKLYRYGKQKKITIGTTVTVLMIVDLNYYILNIGDCRVYELTDGIKQITNDKIINLTGESGSGKSYYTNKYKNNDDYIIIDTDILFSNQKIENKYILDLRKIITSYFDEDLKSLLIIHFDECYKIILDYFKDADKTIIIDSAQYRNLKDISLLKGQVVVMRTCIDTCYKRCIERFNKKFPNATEEERDKYIDRKKSIYNWYHLLNEFIKKLET